MSSAAALVLLTTFGASVVEAVASAVQFVAPGRHLYGHRRV